MIKPSPYLANEHEEHSACGLGYVANWQTGEATNDIVRKGQEILGNVIHRGAVAADLSTGDGAGFMSQIPYKVLAKDETINRGNLRFEKGELAVGQLFMPQNPEAYEEAKQMLYRVLEANGVSRDEVAFRKVPVDESVISPLAKSSMPQFEQVVFNRPQDVEAAAFEGFVRDVLMRLEQDVAKGSDALKKEFYIASMSSETIVYKGLFRSDQLVPFYKDLSDPEYESSFVLVHNRFSTNTTSQWKSAQPFRNMAHNGEINTIKGNTGKWQQERREVRGEEYYIDPQYSDSARMDLILQSRLQQGMSLPDAVMSTSRPAFRNDGNMDENTKAYFTDRALKNDQMDGPQMLILTDGRYVVGHTDSFGLRPAGAVLTKDGQIIFSSEFGTVNVPPKNVERKFNIPAGGVFMVDLQEHKILQGDEVIAHLASQEDFKAKIAARKVTVPDLGYTPTQSKAFPDMLDFQLASGWRSDDVDNILKPMQNTGKSPVSSMGPQIPMASLSVLPRQMSDYFAQRFAQVSNPPLDSVREGESMNLHVYLGQHAAKHENAKFIELDSPLLRPGKLQAIEEQSAIPTKTLDMTFDPRLGEEGLRAALQKLGQDAVAAAKEGNGILIITDRNIDLLHARIDATLAIAAVNHALKEAGVRMDTSIIADTSQVISSHRQAVLLGMGASAVNPYLAYDAITKEAERTGKDQEEQRLNFAKAHDDNMLKIMAKMGIADVNSYIDGKQFEARGVSMQGEFGQYFGGIDSKWGGHGLREIAQNMVSVHANMLLQHHPETLAEHFPQLSNSELKKDDFWYDVQQLTSRLMTITTESLPRYGTYNARQSGESRARDADSITDYRKIEHSHNEEDDIASRRLRAYLSKEPAAREDNNEFIASFPKHMHQIIQWGIENNKVPDFFAPRREDEGYKYNAAELALHTVPTDVATYYENQDTLKAQRPNTFTHLLELSPKGAAVAKEDFGTSIAEGLADFRVAGMSDGAIQYRPHKALARVANNLGGSSNSGEGGERPMRDKGGEHESGRSKVRQVASGRFGVEVRYVAEADMLEIKIAQGAKPGEGGQLTGNSDKSTTNKVTPQIARNRRSLPDVDLVSPPQHHDMYSIEDLEQLIKDLASSGKKIGVKLVASEGIGTIASGVVKAGANFITVAGATGGTGAASTESIHHVGMPVSQGVREVHQTLITQGLRDRTTIVQSGGITTPRDAAMATLTGADKYEIGTDALIKIGGCKLAALCNTGCPVFLTTDGDKYDRPDRTGERELIYFEKLHLETLRELGFKNKQEAIGAIGEVATVRSPEDLHKAGIRGAENFDLSRFLAAPEKTMEIQIAPKELQPPASRSLDDMLIGQIDVEAIRNGQRINIPEVVIRNCDRSFGAKISTTLLYDNFTLPSYELSGKIGKEQGKTPLPLDAVTIHTRGDAGNSFGVLNYGLTIHHEGNANDYVGKAMSHGVISLVKDRDFTANYNPSQNAIAGNKLAFAATGGRVYADGVVGEKAFVRNSGAEGVVMGMGAYGCEYMTRGSVICMSPPGDNFAKGMSGGVVAIYDPEGKFTQKGDFETHRITDFYSSFPQSQILSELGDAVGEMLGRFLHHTKNPVTGEKNKKVEDILANLDQELENFVFVVPKGLSKNITAEYYQKILQAFDGQKMSPLVEAIMNDRAEGFSLSAGNTR